MNGRDDRSLWFCFCLRNITSENLEEYSNGDASKWPWVLRMQGTERSMGPRGVEQGYEEGAQRLSQLKGPLPALGRASSPRPFLTPEVTRLGGMAFGGDVL